MEHFTLQIIHLDQNLPSQTHFTLTLDRIEQLHSLSIKSFEKIPRPIFTASLCQVIPLNYQIYGRTFLLLAKIYFITKYFCRLLWWVYLAANYDAFRVPDMGSYLYKFIPTSSNVLKKFPMVWCTLSIMRIFCGLSVVLLLTINAFFYQLLL